MTTFEDIERVRGKHYHVPGQEYSDGLSGRRIAWGGVVLFAGILLAMILFDVYMPLHK